MDKSLCFASILGEFGLTLQQICDKKASSHHIQLRKVLLDLFAKSGWNKSLRPSVYSDSDKNTNTVHAPSVTILGESTPDRYLGAMDSEHIAEGLLPRFLHIPYEGKRPAKNPKAFHAPSPALVSRLVELAQVTLGMKHNNVCCPVMLNAEAERLMDIFDAEADVRINSGEDEATRQLWNRAHIKALKLAALVAVGCNVHMPIVDGPCAAWAIAVVTRDIEYIGSKFSSGEVGHGDHEQENDMRRAFEKYTGLNEKQRMNYKVPKVLLDKGNLVPFVYLKRFLSLRNAFKNDRRGAVVAVNVALNDCLKAGILAQIPTQQAKDEFKTDSPIFYRGECW